MRKMRNSLSSCANQNGMPKGRDLKKQDFRRNSFELTCCDSPNSGGSLLAKKSVRQIPSHFWSLNPSGREAEGSGIGTMDGDARNLSTGISRFSKISGCYGDSRSLNQDGFQLVSLRELRKIAGSTALPDTRNTEALCDHKCAIEFASTLRKPVTFHDQSHQLKRRNK